MKDPFQEARTLMDTKNKKIIFRYRKANLVSTVLEKMTERLEKKIYNQELHVSLTNDIKQNILQTNFCILKNQHQN